MRIYLIGDIWCLKPEPPVLSQGFIDLFSSETALLVANLETPLVPNNSSPRPKAGPSLKGNPETLHWLKRMSPNLFLSLANNHIMDYGNDGLFQTVAHCRQLEIFTAGAGRNIHEAHQPVCVLVNGHRIGILACCETQFGIASSSRAGVAPLSSKIYEHIRQLHSEVDILIVSIHGAAEMCPWPSPKWQNLLRSLIDAGANIIHGHHSHVPQGYEEYHGGLIFYGLGNFLVDPCQWEGQPDTTWSVTAECTFSFKKVIYSIKTAVIENDHTTIRVRPGSEKEFQQHARYLLHCNQPLARQELLIGLWQEAAVRMYLLWYAHWLKFIPQKDTRSCSLYTWLQQIKRRVLSEFSPKSSLPENTQAVQTQQLLWYHLFACESHSDAITTALGVLSGELDDLRTEETRQLADDMMPWAKGIA